MKTPDEVYEILDQAIAARVAEGFTIITEDGGSPGRKACCAMTALSGNESVNQGIAQLGLDFHAAWEVVAGFDNYKPGTYSDERPEFYEVGKKLRAKWIKQTDHSAA